MKRYGAWNLAFAGVYGWLGFAVGHGRSLAFDLALGLVCALLVVSGLGLLAGARWARLAGIVASSLLLGFAAVTVILLVASAAYLKGVYGALGQGIALVSLLLAALVVEAMALLPIFELRFLLPRR